MKMALITCCKTKATGGEPGYKPSIRLQEGLSKTSYERLMAARCELAELRGEHPGPDLGFEHTAPGLVFLPAYKRYTGRMYKAAKVEELYLASSVRFVIVSALYGILDAEDLIRNYELKMDCRVGGNKVAGYWKEHGLGEILCEYINNLHQIEVHDLLINCYRKALIPWPVCKDQGVSIRIYSYPGQGIGAMYRRGEDLASLLRDC